MNFLAPKPPTKKLLEEAYGLGQQPVAVQPSEAFVIQYIGLNGKVSVDTFIKRRSIFSFNAYYLAWNRLIERGLIVFDDKEYGFILTHEGRVALGQLLRLPLQKEED